MWVFSTRKDWFLCQRQPHETPVYKDKYITPFILKKRGQFSKETLIFAPTKQELLITGIQKIWNDHCPFEAMCVKPRQLEMEN